MSYAVRRVIFGAVVAGGLVLAAAAPAAAHTALEASSPKDGSRIGAAPSEVLLRFTEAPLTTGAHVIVAGPDAHFYQSGPPQISGARLTQPLKPLGPPGTYRVEFRVVADDGHPDVGEMRFTLTKPGPAAGGASQVRPAPFSQVSADTVNDAPAWAPWLELAAVVILASGAVLFGRRMTRGLS
ncbi:MAG: copper resistance protein CopC [Nocardiopsaceae bacterium]|nr:copper resistance protein CopC [Nocardiopsaceae bacterium]